MKNMKREQDQTRFIKKYVEPKTETPALEVIATTFVIIVVLASFTYLIL